MLKRILLGIFGLLLIFVLSPKTTFESKKEIQPKVLGTETDQQRKVSFIKAAPELVLAQSKPELSSKAAFVYDPNSGSILYTHNFDQKLPIASLTKLATAFLAAEQVGLTDVVRVKKKHTQIIGTNMGLVPGEQITVLNLLKGLLISSSNDAALALADYVGGDEKGFVEMMNQKAKLLGLTDTHFSNPIGLDDEDNYSTAIDLSKLVTEFSKNILLAEIVKTKEMTVESFDKKFVHKLTSTNKLLLEDPRVVGIKTGFTSKAQGNLILRAKDGDAEVVTIILGSPNREEDSKKLLDWIFSVYRW